MITWHVVAVVALKYSFLSGLDWALAMSGRSVSDHRVATLRSKHGQVEPFHIRAVAPFLTKERWSSRTVPTHRSRGAVDWSPEHCSAGRSGLRHTAPYSAELRKKIGFDKILLFFQVLGLNVQMIILLLTKTYTIFKNSNRFFYAQISSKNSTPYERSLYSHFLKPCPTSPT